MYIQPIFWYIPAIIIIALLYVYENRLEMLKTEYKVSPN